MTDPIARALGLPIWTGTPRAEPLGGGITNLNLLVTDDIRRAVVRIGDDIPVHQILRFNELAASRAAHAAGISPAVLYHEPGALVIDFITGQTMTASDLCNPDLLRQALELVQRTHRDIPRHLRGPALTFWVFQVLRDYAATLTAAASRHAATLSALLDDAAVLERAVGRIDLVFGHNDLLPANFLHDGTRMWLIDWDYAGWGSPLFDLGGLAANNGLDHPHEEWMLATYFGAKPDADLWRRYAAMKAAAALREAMWSMVQEIHSDLDFDYAAYTADYLDTYRAALAAYRTLA
jgi:thiamine kinase-like enzyme